MFQAALYEQAPGFEPERAVRPIYFDVKQRFAFAVSLECEADDVNVFNLVRELRRDDLARWLHGRREALTSRLRTPAKRQQKRAFLERLHVVS